MLFLSRVETLGERRNTQQVSKARDIFMRRIGGKKPRKKKLGS
jgi:hypothetical protein